MEAPPAALMEIDGAPPKQSSAHDLLEESRTAMEELSSKMLLMKGGETLKSELGEFITRMSLLFIALRQANRSILLEEDSMKAGTDGAKAPVDFTTLQLHNLMYEKNHYLKAIKACRDFRSKHPDMELVPEEEFFREAPDEIKGKLLSSDDGHNLMLKRLEFELFQRKELCERHAKLVRRKKSMVDKIAGQKKFLSSLPSVLKSLKKASVPAQQQLGILHTKKIKQLHLAELLPLPLYILYSQLSAQKDAFGEKIDMEILGNIKDAQTFTLQEANKENGLLPNSESNRFDDDIPDEEEDGQRRRKRSKKNTSKDTIHQSGSHQCHPLKTILRIYDDKASEYKPVPLITLRFEYLVKLNVVCVGIDGVEDRCNDYMLCNLFPDDTGMEFPHQVAKACAGESTYIVGTKGLRPYKWAQHLAGMDILPELPPALGFGEIVKVSDIKSGLSLYRHQNRVKTILERIRLRKKAQMALVQQLDSLMKLKWPPLGYENVPWASWNHVCTLHQWSSAGNQESQQVASISGIDTRRSPTPIEEAENAREDGELPLVLQVSAVSPKPKIVTLEYSSEIEHSRTPDSSSKNTAPFKKLRPLPSRRYGDELELLLDSESDLEEEKARNGLEAENTNTNPEIPWEDLGSKEFRLVLSRVDSNERSFNLEAKVLVNMEYPVRAPVFSLNMSTDPPSDGNFRWNNELRAMEAEVNAHIIRLLPPEYGVFTLAHQVHCLSMLFDFHFAPSEERQMPAAGAGPLELFRGSSAVMRPFRGRDRRKIFPWTEDETV